MANCAEPNPIGATKFARLTALQRHKLLARLAIGYAEAADLPGFFSRYRELVSVGGIDHFDPPSWLSMAEAHAQTHAFHARLAHLPLELPDKRDASTHDPCNKGKLDWKPRFQVEVVATQIRNPFNFGAILRLIDNFGLANLTHDSNWIALDHPRLRSAARGCEAWIPIRYEADLPTHLQEQRASGQRIYALEEGQDALSVRDWKPQLPCLLIVGNESFGIPDAVRAQCDQTIHIPMMGYKNSMNLSHALAIAAYQIGNMIPN